ncbi:MAG: HAMP domain-containing sensor histidine kinase [Kiritimatiellia bacterium]
MKHYRLNLNLTDVIILVAVGVLVPVMLSTGVGIVALVLATDAGGIVTGVLMISFAAAAAGSALIAVVLTGRKARLARRQADFLANMSHELRTPLSTIKLYTQTLQSGALADNPDETAECLATILRETQWLDLMVDRVLTWRASSKDLMPLEMAVKPVSESITGAAKRFRTMVPPERLRFSVSVKTALPVRHDSNALNTVILNLLTNAYKYTGNDKDIELAAEDENDYVRIEVRDNGPGLTAAEIKRAFQPFYRMEKSNGRAGGTGLGLSIVGYLVKTHGGMIDVDSRKGEGSTFVIRLPAATE